MEKFWVGFINGIWKGSEFCVNKIIYINYGLLK